MFIAQQPKGLGFSKDFLHAPFLLTALCDRMSTLATPQKSWCNYVRKARAWREHVVEEVHGAHLAVEPLHRGTQAALTCFHARSQAARIQRLCHLRCNIWWACMPNFAWQESLSFPHAWHASIGYHRQEEKIGMA